MLPNNVQESISSGGVLNITFEKECSFTDIYEFDYSVDLSVMA